MKNVVMFCFQGSHDVPFFCSDILMMFPMLFVCPSFIVPHVPN
jgi:hypothetical protein